MYKQSLWTWWHFLDKFRGFLSDRNELFLLRLKILVVSLVRVPTRSQRVQTFEYLLSHFITIRSQWQFDITTKKERNKNHPSPHLSVPSVSPNQQIVFWETDLCLKITASLEKQRKSRLSSFSKKSLKYITSPKILYPLPT